MTGYEEKVLEGRGFLLVGGEGDGVGDGWHNDHTDIVVFEPVV